MKMFSILTFFMALTIFNSVSQAAVILKAERGPNFMPNSTSETFTLDDSGNVQVTTKDINTGKEVVTQLGSLNKNQLADTMKLISQVDSNEVLRDQEPDAPTLPDSATFTVSIPKGDKEILVLKKNQGHMYTPASFASRDLARLGLAIFRDDFHGMPSHID